MPSVAEFLGMIIYVYWREHPPAHFHVRYGDMWGAIDIETGKLVEGELPRKKLKKIDEWRMLHKQELLNAWNNAQQHISPEKIEPL